MFQRAPGGGGRTRVWAKQTTGRTQTDLDGRVYTELTGGWVWLNTRTS